MKFVYGILALSVLVFLHELGHFIFAKIFHVDVEAFSIGFGPRLLHKTFRGTDYRVSLLPLGGYCAMKGENDFQDAIEKGTWKSVRDKHSLYGIHPLKRAAIGFAGPFANIVFAFFAFFFVELIGYTYYTYSAKIKVLDDASPAKIAGLQDGDVILKINKNEIADFSDIIENIASHPNERALVTIDRNNETLTFPIDIALDTKTGSGKIGITNFSNEVIEKKIKSNSLFEASKKSILQIGQAFILTWKSIALLFHGLDFKSALSGPAGVANMLGDAVQNESAIVIASIMAIISLSLAIMNLLPIPILDGGLILFALIETFTKRPINAKLQYYIQFVGLAFILAIFALGVISDIYHFLGKV